MAEDAGAVSDEAEDGASGLAVVRAVASDGAEDAATVAAQAMARA